MITRSDYKTLIHDWEKTGKLFASLERYQAILGDEEVSSEDVALVMSTALENIDPEFDIKEGSTITLRAIKEALVAAAKVAWEILKQIYQYLNALYVRFTGSIRRVRANQTRVMRRLGSLGSKTSYSSTINVAGLQRLSVDGKFVGVDMSNLQDIKAIANYTLTVYPRCVTQIARNASRQFLNLLDVADGENNKEVSGQLIEVLADIFERNFREPPDSTDVRQGEIGGQTKFLKRSTALVGNSAFVYTDPRVISNEFRKTNGNAASTVASALHMNFQELSLNVADKSEREIDLPTVRDLTQLTEEISRILTIAEKAETGRRDFSSVKTVVDDAIRQAMERTENKAVVPVAQTVMTVLGEVSKKLAEPMDNFMHWLAITLNVWLNFIDHCVDHYENEGI